MTAIIERSRTCAHEGPIFLVPIIQHKMSARVSTFPHMPKFGECCKPRTGEFSKTVKKDAICCNAEQETCNVHSADDKTAKTSLMNFFATTEYFQRENHGKDEHVTCQNGRCLKMPLALDEQTMMHEEAKRGSHDSIAK
jgi:hypothetical protein